MLIAESRLTGRILFGKSNIIISYAWFPAFRCRSAVAVSRSRFAVPYRR